MIENLLNSLTYNAAMVSKIPFLFFFAGAFYVSAVICFVGCIINNEFRRKMLAFFSLPHPSSGEQMLSLDALRGIAIVGVASYHSWQWFGSLNNDMFEFMPLSPILHGYKGVCLFVVLSGFLIYRSLKDKLLGSDDLSYYAKRRFLRIYPVYLANVIILLLLGFIHSDPSIIQNFMAAVFMFYTYKHPFIAYSPAWSLYVEVFFYICLPIWVAVTKKNPLAYTLAALVALCLTGGHIEAHVPGELQVMRYFFIGIIASEILDRVKITQFLAVVMLIIGLGLIYVDCQGRDVFSELIMKSFELLNLKIVLDTTIYNSITLMVAFALILVGVIKYSPAYSLLSFYPFRFIGIISYSVFMWHGVVLMMIQGFFNSRPETVFKGDPITLIGVYWPAFLFIGTLSYLFIERPFQKWRHR